MNNIRATSNQGQFRVQMIGEPNCTLDGYGRREFYKISLITQGWPPCQLCYGSLEPVEVDRPALVILDPIVPHSWILPEPEVATEGYFCLFDEAFIRNSAPLNALVHQFFMAGKVPLYFPDEGKLAFYEGLFKNMYLVSESQYKYKQELFGSFLSILFHEALIMDHSDNKHVDNNTRISSDFFDLLRGQFPMALPLKPIMLKKASDFAAQLAIHVNHLNAAVKHVSGKSTTQHINELLFAEAKSLLSFTNYSIAEIAFSLGFEYQSYFNRFFKKTANMTPSEFRKNVEKYK